MVLLWIVLDTVLTVGASVVISWFMITRYLAKRSNTRLGRDDVALLRDMNTALVQILTVDEMSSLGIPTQLETKMRELVDRYTHTKETT